MRPGHVLGELPQAQGEAERHGVPLEVRGERLDGGARPAGLQELADVRLSLGGCADLDETLRTAERKTAVYSFQLPLRAAVILAGREDLDTGVRRLGRDLGLAFQLRDDLDGVFGDPAETGKSNASDLREGKCTPLVALAHGTSAWGELSTLLGDPDAGDAPQSATARTAAARARSPARMPAAAP